VLTRLSRGCIRSPEAAPPGHVSGQGDSPVASEPALLQVWASEAYGTASYVKLQLCNILVALYSSPRLFHRPRSDMRCKFFRAREQMTYSNLFALSRLFGSLKCGTISS